AGAEAEQLLAGAAAVRGHARQQRGRDSEARAADRRGHAADAAGCVQEILPGGTLHGRDADATRDEGEKTKNAKTAKHAKKTNLCDLCVRPSAAALATVAPR